MSTKIVPAALKWVRGTCQSALSYVSPEQVCFASGNYIRLYNITNRQCEYFSPPGDGICCISSSYDLGVVAVSELCLSPSIYVLKYPTFNCISKLEKGTEVEYLSFLFTGTEYLLSLAGSPNYSVILWRWPTGKKLYVAPQSSFVYEPSFLHLSANPSSWFQFCLQRSNGIDLLEIEGYEEDVQIHQKTLYLPLEDDEEGKTALTDKDILSLKCFNEDEEESWSFYTDILTSLPMGSVTGLQKSELLEFYDYNLKQKRVVPKCHCWLPHNDIIVSCTNGTVLKINTEEPMIKIIRFVDRDSSNSSQLEEEITCLAFSEDGLFAGLKKGGIELVKVSSDSWLLLKRVTLDGSLRSVLFSPSYDTLTMITDQGSVFLYNPSSDASLRCIIHGDNTEVVGMSMIQPNTHYCITAKNSGLIQIWDCLTGYLESEYSVGEEINCMNLSPTCSCAVVGTSGGYVHFLDVNNKQKVRTVEVIRPYDSYPSHIRHDNFGQFLLLCAKNDFLVIVNGLPSSGFRICGHVDIKYEVADIAAFCKQEFSTTTAIIIARSATDASSRFADMLLRMDIPPDLGHDPEKYRSNILGSLKGDVFEMRSWKMEYPGSGLAVHYDLGAIIFSATTRKLQILPIWINSETEVLSPDAMYHSYHETDECMLFISDNHQWLASVNPDGKLCIYSVQKLDCPFVITPHSFWKRGTACACFFTGKNMILSGGKDGTMVCHELKADITASDHLPPPWIASCASHAAGENLQLSKMEEFENDYTEMSSLMSKVHEEEENRRDSSFNTAISTILEKMEALKKRVERLMEQNDLLPPDSRLAMADFALDREFLQKRLNENKNKIKLFRNQLKEELLGLKKMAAAIKEECWDSMAVKGKKLKAFNSGLSVCNYPLTDRSKEELQELNRVLQQREVDTLEKQSRRRYMEETRQKTIDVPSGFQGEKDNSGAFSGSLRGHFGVQSTSLYDQMELRTREQKGSQIILMKDVVYRLKQAFNKIFDKDFERKEAEVSRIQERNERILEIASFLEQEETVWEPKWDDDERPENVLVVRDDEIKAEKFYTAEELKLMEEQKAKSATEKGKGMRDKALDSMMGGSLESRKEDQLKKDPPPPAFMIAKPQTEWTIDEHQLAREYEKKLTEVREMREKYTRNLKTELVKLKESIVDSCNAYDVTLQDLYEKKVLCDFIVFQEELKVLIMTFSILIENELEEWELYIQEGVKQKHNRQKRLYPILINASKVEAEAKDVYESLQTAERQAEAHAKREYKSLTDGDALYRAFRKRPRTYMATKTESRNPFRKSLELTKENIKMAFRELDSPLNCPEEVDKITWRRMCGARHDKTLLEEKAKFQALKVAELSAQVHKREKEQNLIHYELEALSKTLKTIRELRLRCQEDLPVFLIMKQGYVEVDFPESAPKFLDSVLVQRDAVDQPNEEIRSLGEKKFGAMRESQTVRHDIRKLQWNQKRLQMKLEDMEQLLKDIQAFRVTRDMRRFLDGDTRFGPDTKIDSLEKAIELQEKFFNKQKNLLEDEYEKLENDMREKHRESVQLEEAIRITYAKVCDLRRMQNEDTQNT